MSTIHQVGLTRSSCRRSGGPLQLVAELEHLVVFTYELVQILLTHGRNGAPRRESVVHHEQARSWHSSTTPRGEDQGGPQETAAVFEKVVEHGAQLGTEKRKEQQHTTTEEQEGLGNGG